MIASLEGKIKYKKEKFVVVDVSGVGYQVFVSAVFMKDLEVGSEYEIITFLYGRENSLELYGFPSFEEMDFFKQLISVSGVGPKSALGILSVAKLEDIQEAVLRGSPEFLTKVSGIGKKTAERIIVELKSKIKEGDFKAKGARMTHADEEAIDALVSLGYNVSQAREALRQVPEEVGETGARIKEALRALGKH